MCALNNNLYERLAIEDADNFLRQSVFECANEDCDSHKKYEKTGFNADFNAARNMKFYHGTSTASTYIDISVERRFEKL